MSADRLPSPWRHPILHLGDHVVERMGPGRRRAGWWEARLWLSVSPLAYLGLRMTRRRPVVRLRRFGTLVNDPGIGRRILTDAERFRTVGPGTHGELLDVAIGPNALLNMDGPAHERLRRSLAPLFSREASAELVAKTVGEPIDEALARLRMGGSVDLVRLVRVVTGRTTFALLGAQPPDSGDEGYLASYRLGEELVGMTVSAIRRGVRPGELESAKALVERFAEPGRAGWEEGSGTIGRLRELGFAWDEARALIVVIALAGTETVSSALPRIIARLLDHGRWDTVQAGGPAAADAAIQAALRLVTPTEVIVRSSATRTTIDGHTFEANERLFLSLYGMARWPRLFSGDPEALDVGDTIPSELRHLWFGAGPHFCLGAPIALDQLGRLIGALAQFPKLRIVDRRPASGVLFPAYARFLVTG